ncbi:MAG: hypothetical protein HGA86_06550, partial [Anaerolineaceae bacterium]|nr:hypothetical protein [Anaerolineaceae bacterium]
RWQMTGNAHTLILGKRRARIHAEFGRSADLVLSTAELRQTLLERGSADEEQKTFRQIAFPAYLASLDRPRFGEAVGVVVAEGEISAGREPAGRIGGLSTAELIRKARNGGYGSNLKFGLKKAAELGAEIIKISLPHTKYALPVYYLLAPAEASANLARYDGVRFGLREPSDKLLELFCSTRGSGFGAEVKRRIMLGTYALSAGYYDAYYGQAQKVRTLIKRDFDEVFNHVDVIACPVTPSTAFKIGEHTDDPLAMYLEDVFTLPANLAGVPGIAFPVGEDSNHLPIGMQLMGRPFQEEKLFQTVHAYQQFTQHHLLFPSL